MDVEVLGTGKSGIEIGLQLKHSSVVQACSKEAKGIHIGDEGEMDRLGDLGRPGKRVKNQENR